MSFADITIGFFILLIWVGALGGGTIWYLQRKPEVLPPAKYDLAVAEIEENRRAQIESATSAFEIDDVEARWDAALKQIKRGKE